MAIDGKRFERCWWERLGCFDASVVGVKSLREGILRSPGWGYQLFLPSLMGEKPDLKHESMSYNREPDRDFGRRFAHDHNTINSLDA